MPLFLKYSRYFEMNSFSSVLLIRLALIANRKQLSIKYFWIYVVQPACNWRLRHTYHGAFLVEVVSFFNNFHDILA